LASSPGTGKLLDDYPPDHRKENQLRRIALAGLAALTTALGTAAGAAGPASAAPATAPATASAVAPAARAAAGPLANDLFGVACVAPRNCLAVGEDITGFNRGSGGALAETWNGAAWQKVAVRLPSGATRGAFDHVTCLSATDCIAAGISGKGNRLSPLADTWNGRTWTPARLPGAPGRYTSLNALSCPSVRSCVGGGSYTTTVNGALSGPLADIWNGATWRQTVPPAPAGTYYSIILDVSCVSATFCVAVGQYATRSSGGGMIDSWNGRSWRLMRAAWPRGTSFGALAGVSCVSAKNCIAVGGGGNARGLVTVAERWDGTSWALTPVRWPRGTTNAVLTGVSCPAVNRCVAVAAVNQNLIPNSNQGKAAAVTWNGRAWATTSTPTPARGLASLFNDVTCLSATDCVAVGQLGPVLTLNGVGLSGFWNGRRWRLVTAK
jgi:hypothetical protein